ncbi:MAG: sporulation protein YqfC [Limnochordales bacterium]|nr:sporulation protein YqfC [Limnochordales bacterium]
MAFNILDRMRRVAGNLGELPPDLVLDLPRLTVVGGLQVHVENHRGLLYCSSEEIRIRMRRGEVNIRGQRLRLAMLRAEELTIEGTLDAISFVRT